MRLHWTATLSLILVASPALVAQQTTLNVIRHDQQLQQYRQMIDRGIEYLRLRGQAADGSFSGKSGIGPTALVVSALLQLGQAPGDPMVQQGLKFLKAQVQADGGIYSKESLHRSYETCIAVVAFHLANQDGQYDQIVAQAEKYIRGIQWDESEGVERTDMAYGGAGYGSQSRPDLSNTSFLIDTLRSLGNGPDDEAIQKALIFVSRCQNLETPYNDSKHAAAVDDGGFYYTVAAGGESKAEPLPGGGLRSYGSMSYAGLKSMIYAGVNKDDVRVRAVLDFLRKNYDVQSNPGMGQQGLFYYYHTLAKALDAAEIEVFDDASGKSHDWKQQLRDRLAHLQQEDGSWVNPTTRWMEGDPNLVSAYVLLALANCKP
jgi:squalene-hopene/tetraprenyl-beta-curcumene cyclase